MIKKSCRAPSPDRERAQAPRVARPPKCPSRAEAVGWSLPPVPGPVPVPVPGPVPVTGTGIGAGTTTGTGAGTGGPVPVPVVGIVLGRPLIYAVTRPVHTCALLVAATTRRYEYS